VCGCVRRCRRRAQNARGHRMRRHARNTRGCRQARPAKMMLTVSHADDTEARLQGQANGGHRDDDEDNRSPANRGCSARTTAGQAGDIHAGADNSVDVGPVGNEAKLSFGFAPAGAASTSGAWAPQLSTVCAPTMRTLKERRTYTTVDEQDHPRAKDARMNTTLHANAMALITPQQAHMPTATTLITTERASMPIAEPDPDRPATIAERNHQTATATATDRPARPQRTATTMTITTAEVPPAIVPTPTPAIIAPAITRMTPMCQQWTSLPRTTTATIRRSEAPQSPKVPAASTGGAAAKGALKRTAPDAIRPTFRYTMLGDSQLGLVP